MRRSRGRSLMPRPLRPASSSPSSRLRTPPPRRDPTTRTARELMAEAAGMLHDSLALDHLDEHDLPQVVAALAATSRPSTRAQPCGPRGAVAEDDPAPCPRGVADAASAVGRAPSGRDGTQPPNGRRGRLEAARGRGSRSTAQLACHAVTSVTARSPGGIGAISRVAGPDLDDGPPRGDDLAVDRRRRRRSTEDAGDDVGHLTTGGPSSSRLRRRGRRGVQDRR